MSARPIAPPIDHYRVSASLPLLFLLFLLFTAISFAQELRPTESQVEAAYLYNFGKFVRWQEPRISAADTRGICVLGKDPFGPVLDSTVAGESLDGKKITVSRLARIQDGTQCSILFVSSSEENRLGGILATAQLMGILTVSNLSHFAERGGVIGFVVIQGRIRFVVNRTAAEQSRLALSSELLKVAIRVIDKPGGAR